MQRENVAQELRSIEIPDLTFAVYDARSEKLRGGFKTKEEGELWLIGNLPWIIWNEATGLEVARVATAFEADLILKQGEEAEHLVRTRAPLSEFEVLYELY